MTNIINGRGRVGVRPPSGNNNGGGSGGGYGALTTAWIAATGESDATILSALNTLESDLNTYGLTSKMKALYPFVGGNATKHSFNFVNTAQFQLAFNGGWSHSSTGALPNGTNGYADTKLIPNAALTFANTHFSLYSRTNNYSSAWNGSSNSYLPIMSMRLKYNQVGYDATEFDGYDYGSHRLVGANSDSRGHFVANITSTTNQKIFKNGTSIATNTTAQSQTTLPSYSIWLATRNDSGFPDTYDSKELAFSSIGDGLTDTEAANFYTAVQAFQTTLGRQV